MDSWWMDASEPELDVPNAKQTFLGSGSSVRNPYPLYVTYTIFEGQRSTTDRKGLVILTRSSFVGGDQIPGKRRSANSAPNP
ncbi:MAG: TIM-barrel domain-containing protein [Acidobacteriota bacterium]